MVFYYTTCPCRVGTLLIERRAGEGHDDGLDVVKVLMTAYQSAEEGRTLEFPPAGIEQFMPQVAKGTWKP